MILFLTPPLAPSSSIAKPISPQFLFSHSGSKSSSAFRTISCTGQFPPPKWTKDYQDRIRKGIKILEERDENESKD